MASSSNVPVGVRKGAWMEEEDILLKKCIEKYGEGKWHLVPSRAGLNRCRKSCRLRWLNYLHPNIKRGNFTCDEVDLIARLHKLLGNRWSLIAGRLPGRTANDVKNFWNTHLQKKYSNTRDDTKGCRPSETSETTTIIKPRPRTFSRKASWLGQKTTSEANDITRIKENINLDKSSPSSSSPLNIDENGDVMQWWETMFDNCCKENDEGPSWSSLSGSEEFHVDGLWSDQGMLPAGVNEEDDNLLQEKLNEYSDMSIDMDIWGLINSKP